MGAAGVGRGEGGAGRGGGAVLKFERHIKAAVLSQAGHIQ